MGLGRPGMGKQSMAENESIATGSETETTAVVTETTTTQDAETVDWEAKAKQLEADAKKWQDFSRKNEAAAKAAAKELEKSRQAQMTDVERAQAAASEAEKRAAAAETAMLRYRVAATKQLPADLVDRLRGDTEEEMLADADTLLKLVKPAAPKPDPTQGARGAGSGVDMNSLLRSAAGRG